MLPKRTPVCVVHPAALCQHASCVNRVGGESGSDPRLWRTGVLGSWCTGMFCGHLQPLAHSAAAYVTAAHGAVRMAHTGALLTGPACARGTRGARPVSLVEGQKIRCDRKMRIFLVQMNNLIADLPHLLLSAFITRRRFCW